MLGALTDAFPELEQGIQYAYVQAVRSAQRFLYIENQYFLGSASHWLERSNVECMNLIPYEVAHRIHQAIKLDQMFTAYIVMPYFPEGACAHVTKRRKDTAVPCDCCGVLT